MEQYGIFYFFDHEEKKHTLVLSDDLSAHQPCPEQPKVSWNPQGSDNLDEDVITSLQWEETFRFGKYAVTDYNFETPSTSLRAEVKTQIEVGGNSKYEIYDYPGEYGKKAEGDGIAKIRMQEEEAQYKVISGNGTARVFTTGYKFTLQDYVRKDVNGDYVLTQVQHVASVGNTYATGSAGGGNEDDYSNSFACIPAKRPFRSPQVTPKPMVQGPQTAVVVGKSGEEIWTDKYGRVKVQFHWDRYGKMNESSSCWVRVSQNWAGKNWGAMFIPRMGQEVIVEFLEGDPDQPIITGRVYNAEQTVPYPLPAEQTKSTIKSNSSKGGGGSNEFRFEDKKGSEEIFLHGQKDWNILIENDKGQTIGHDETLHVKNDRTKLIDHDENSEIINNRNKKVDVDQSETIGRNKSIKVGGGHTEQIEGSMMITVGSTLTESVLINYAETVGGAMEQTVGGALAITVGGAMAETVGGARVESVGLQSSENVGKNKSVNIGKDLSESVGQNKDVNVVKDFSETIGGQHKESVTKEYILNAKKVQIVAEDEINIKTGKAEITMKKNGDITINGKKITVEGSGNVILKGSKVLSN
jgi:type VI secretion system secreted protein VgrG